MILISDNKRKFSIFSTEMQDEKKIDWESRKTYFTVASLPRRFYDKKTFGSRFYDKKTFGSGNSKRRA